MAAFAERNDRKSVKRFSDKICPLKRKTFGDGNRRPWRRRMVIDQLALLLVLRRRPLRLHGGHFRHWRWRGAGAGVLRVLSPRWRPAGSADAALYRHFAGHHHSDFDQLRSAPTSSAARWTWNPETVVARSPAWRRRRQPSPRALPRSGCSRSFRLRRLVGGRPAVPGARQLEVRRARADRSLDARLWFLYRPALDLDGRRRWTVRQSADDILTAGRSTRRSPLPRRSPC